MVRMFRVYRAGDLDAVHERRQMDQLIHLMHQRFAQTTEDCRLLIDIRVGSQIDGLVFKDNRLVILELKDVGGAIAADCAPGGQWKRTDQVGGSEAFTNNPFFQARGHRRNLLHFLFENVLQPAGSQGSQVPEDEIPDPLRRSVTSWVVLRAGSRVQVVGVEKRAHPWFDVMPLDQVPWALGFEKQRDPMMTESQISRFLELVGAEERPWDEWVHRGQILAEETPRPTNSPRVDFLLSSPDVENVLRGLQYVRELDLRGYLEPLLAATGHESASVRFAALEILAEWGVPELGVRLAEALEDPAAQVRDAALTLVTRGSYPAAIPALARLLDGPAPLVRMVLDGLAATGDPTACGVLAKFIDRLAWSADNAALWAATCRALGDLGCRDGVPWLTGILSEPTTRGIDPKSPAYEFVFAAAAKALGRLGDPRALPHLVRLLGDSDDNDDVLIRALGGLGPEGAAAEVIIPYLERGNDFLVIDAVTTLGQMRATKAIPRLWSLYLEHFHNDDMLSRAIAEALARIDPSEFERLVLAEIRSPGRGAEDVERLLYAMAPVVSEASIPPLTELMHTADHSDTAAWLLARFVDDPRFVEAVETLLAGDNPHSRAGAVWIMSRAWGRELFTRLDGLERDSSPEVRRAVTAVYELTKTPEGASRLLRFVRDPDPQVRDNVFHGFLLQATLTLPDCVVSLTDGRVGQQTVAAGMFGVAVPFEDEILVIPPERATRATIITEDGEAVALLLGYATNRGTEWALVLPVGAPQLRMVRGPSHPRGTLFEVTPAPPRQIVNRQFRDLRDAIEGLAGRSMGNIEPGPDEKRIADSLEAQARRAMTPTPQ